MHRQASSQVARHCSRESELARVFERITAFAIQSLSQRILGMHDHALPDAGSPPTQGYVWRRGGVTRGRRPIGERANKKPAADGSARALDSSCDDGVIAVICPTGQAQFLFLRNCFSRARLDRELARGSLYKRS